MKAILKSSYRNKKREVAFMYVVTGTPAELKAYRIAQGEFYAEDKVTSQPLWFTNQAHGRSCDLIITDSGVYADTLDEDLMNAELAKRVNTDSGKELAKLDAAQIFANLKSGTRQRASIALTPENQAVTKTEVEEPVLDNGSDAKLDDETTPF